MLPAERAPTAAPAAAARPGRRPDDPIRIGRRSPDCSKPSLSASAVCSSTRDDQFVVLPTAEGLLRRRAHRHRHVDELEAQPRRVRQAVQVQSQAVGDVDHGVRPRRPGQLALAETSHRPPVRLAVTGRRPQLADSRSSRSPAADPPQGPVTSTTSPGRPPERDTGPGPPPRPSRAPSPPPPARRPPTRRPRRPGTRSPPRPPPLQPSPRAPAAPSPEPPGTHNATTAPTGDAPIAARSLSAPISAFQPTSPGLHSGQVDVDAGSTTLSTETTSGPAPEPQHSGVVTQAERLDSISEDPPNRLDHLVFAGERACRRGLGDPTAHA